MEKTVETGGISGRRETEGERKIDLKSYLEDQRSVLLLSGVFMLLVVLVYSLYGLPWGPAGYVLALDGTILLTVLTVGYGRYRRKLEALARAKNQGEYIPACMPKPEGAAERAYRQILDGLCEKQKAEAERYAASCWEARQYYTRWSHQIKTPIAGIRLLLEEEEPDRSELNRELYRIQQYVEMVLQYQRLDGKSDDLVLREYELDKIVKNALKKTAVLFRHKEIVLELGDLDRTLVTDEKWLAFVIEQLVANAVKYTKKGSIFLGLLSEDASGNESGNESGNNGDVLLIRDTGIGIRKEDLPRIFDWGYTGYNGRENHHSTGIGLSLCRQTLALLGHEIRIESEPGAGTCVMIDLTQKRLEQD